MLKKVLYGLLLFPRMIEAQYFYKSLITGFGRHNYGGKTMKGKNVILITMDEVRHDHLSCYGYTRINTPNLDYFAHDGVLFETVASTTCFTPISHATILTGVYPSKHNMRDPFSMPEWKMISEIFKENGYATAGFVGVNLIGKANGFDKGFLTFDEPKHEEVWKISDFAGDDRGELLWGNWWIPRMLEWVRFVDKPFFIWCHYFDVHQAAENILLELGKIKEGVMPEYGYYDPKIEYMDKAFFGPLREVLSDLQIEDETTVLITSDHGTNLEEHEVPPFPHLDLVYPQHTTMYDCDLLVPLIIKDMDVPKNKVIPGMVRTVDIVPTLLDLAGMAIPDDLDGVSLCSFIKNGKAEGLLAYAEELYEKRGPGDFQAIRDDLHKYIIDHRNGGQEEFYDIKSDPVEKTNLMDSLSKNQENILTNWRNICEEYRPRKDSTFKMDNEVKEKLTERLQMLGYIE